MDDYLSEEQLEEFFLKMLGKTIEGVATEDDELELTLSDGTVVIVWSSEDLSMTVVDPDFTN